MAWNWTDGTLVNASMMQTNVELRLRALEAGGSALFKAFGAGTTATVINTYTPIGWAAPVLDTATGWVSASPTVYTCQVAGWYDCRVSIGFANAFTGDCLLSLFVNGVSQGGRTTMTGSGLTGSYRGGAAISHLLQLSVGDALSASYFVSTLTNCALGSGTTDPTSVFELQKIAS